MRRERVECVIWKSEGKFWIHEYDGAPANMLWMDVKCVTYCFRYNHEKETIEIHKDSAKGIAVNSFTNTTTLSQLKSFFDKL